MAGIFGNMFDFNRDGELNSLERATEFAFLNDMLCEEEAEEPRQSFHPMSTMSM